MNASPTVVARLIVPLGAFAVLLVTIPFSFPGRAQGFALLLTAYVLPPAGKETIIPAAAAAGYSPILTATYIACLDATMAWLLAWNWDLLLRLPIIGPGCRRIEGALRKRVAAKPRGAKVAFGGLVLFTFLPFQGSGATIGTFLGRLMGLGPSTTWLAVLIGVTIGAYALAFAALGLTTLPPALQWTIIGGIALAGAVQAFVLARRKRT